MLERRSAAPVRKSLTGVAVVVAVLLATAPLAACGSASSHGATATKPPLLVSAATSLKRAFTAYGSEFAPAHVRLSFAGSDELAAQIRQGVAPDVFASANTKLPDALHVDGLVGTPVVFAANRLVLAVPASSTKVRSLADLAKPGTTIAIGSPSVPIGAYTRTVLAGLGAAQAGEILANVRSNEPDVGGIVGKVSQGAVDAGFVYVTDVDGSGGALRAIELPARLQPRVAYGVAIVTHTKHPAQARAFVAGLLHGAGQRALHAAGFEPPPAP
jgi:molybdate transport system substrate-binding protein